MSRVPLLLGRSRRVAAAYRCLTLLFAGLTLAAGWVSAQEKPPIIVDDYEPWKRITSTALSPDGAWMSYGYDRIEGEDTLYVAALDREASYAVPRGTAPAFSRDSRWVAYLVSPPERRMRVELPARGVPKPLPGPEARAGRWWAKPHHGPPEPGDR